MGYLPHLKVGCENWLIFIIHAIIGFTTLKIKFWYLGCPFDDIYSGKCTAKNYKEYFTFMWNNSPKLMSNTFTNDIKSISEVNSLWNTSERFCLKRIP